MTEKVITIDEFAEMAEQDQAAMNRAVSKTVERIAPEVLSLAAAYPEEGPWNWPAAYPARWYQRLKGPRWARKDGSVGGKNTSEQLQYSWQQEATDTQLRTWTPVSYSPYVVGNQITDFHQAHGWKNMDTLADEYADRAQEVLLEETEKEFSE